MTTKFAASTRWLFFCAALIGFTHPPATAQGDESTTVTDSPPITVELWVAELSVPALKGMGLDTNNAQLKPDADASLLEMFQSPKKMPPAIAGNLVQVLDFLKDRKAAHIVAQPKLMTCSGQPASLDVGLMKMGATPTFMDDGKIRVECRLEISKLTKTVDPVTKTPGRQTFRMDCAVGVESGKAVLCGPAIPTVGDNEKVSGDKFKIVVLRATTAGDALGAQATADRKGTYVEVVPKKTR